MKLHAYVKGRVQGVGFRYYVRDRADELSLDGWVKNLPDRRVELEALGFDEELDRLEKLLWQGPPGARVEDVTARRTDGEPDGSGFRIEFW
ncbi:MAG TPA: acylphosphatase [Armatimonadota bacterium]|jgi:acylphosphatase|nr:acylphosphatase [Armatimonadota bacterium]